MQINYKDNNKKIIFYSNVHLGDLHLSRSYIRWFIENFNTDFTYTHNYDPQVLSDIDHLTFDKNKWRSLPRNGDIIELEEAIFFNTWIGSGGLAMGVNFDAIHFLFSKYFNFLIQKGFSSKETVLPKLLPKIDFKHPSLFIKNIDEWFKNRNCNRKIFICNNTPESGQSFLNNLNQLILIISNNNPQDDIYLSNQVEPLIDNEKNIFYAEKIINKNYSFNLNELSYFSTYCDIIIGRGSGPFSFSEVEENLNKIWLSLTSEHLALDSFNGLNKFKNKGKYIHTLDIKTGLREAGV